MNPKTVAKQCMAYSALVVLSLFLAGDVLTEYLLWLSVAFLVLYLAANMLYSRQLTHNGIGRNTLRPTTDDVSRVRGDRIVADASIICCSMSVAVAAASQAAGGVQVTSAVPGIVAGSVTTAAAAIYGSSLIDWYWIRPRRDGVVGIPTCHDQARESYMGIVTRVWLVHRSLAAGAVIVGALVVLVGGLAMLQYLMPKDRFSSLLVATVGAPLAIVAVAVTPWARGMLVFIPWIGSNLKAYVGENVSVVTRTQEFSGLVVDVSLDRGLGIVPDDPHKGYLNLELNSESIIHRFVGGASLTRCGATGDICGGWDKNGSCQWGSERTDRRSGAVTSRQRETHRSRWYVR